MASYTQLYLHCIWATWDRLPLITPAIEPRLYGAIASKCKDLNCSALAIGGVDDHVHVLIRFSTTITIARLIGEIKGASSHVMTHSIAAESFFRWQGSYGVFSLSNRSVPQVRDYVLNQKAHHARRTVIIELEQCIDSEGDIE